MVDVSVVICTYNRAESLRETLESLASQDVKHQLSYEIIVVDNNSKDNTRQMVEEFQTRNGHAVQYVFEKKQGVSYARNTGIRCAKGEIIAYLDDDVIADSYWLEAMWTCFQETKADAVGSKVLRKWNSDQPNWYSEEIGGCLISQDLGPKRVKCSSKRQHLVGASIAFRKDVFERCGIFREELGRRGDELVGGEDSELYKRLLKENQLVMYEPNAVVHHKIEPERLTKIYFKRWFWDVGRTLGHELEWKWHFVITIAPLWLWKQALSAIFRFLKVEFYPPSTSSERFAAEVWVLHYWGMITERFFHWLPFKLGRKKCAFGGEFKK